MNFKLIMIVLVFMFVFNACSEYDFSSNEFNMNESDSFEDNDLDDDEILLEEKVSSRRSITEVDDLVGEIDIGSWTENYLDLKHNFNDAKIAEKIEVYHNNEKICDLKKEVYLISNLNNKIKLDECKLINGASYNVTITIDGIDYYFSLVYKQRETKVPSNMTEESEEYDYSDTSIEALDLGREGLYFKIVGRYDEDNIDSYLDYVKLFDENNNLICAFDMDSQLYNNALLMAFGKDCSYESNKNYQVVFVTYGGVYSNYLTASDSSEFYYNNYEIEEEVIEEEEEENLDETVDNSLISVSVLRFEGNDIYLKSENYEGLINGILIRDINGHKICDVLKNIYINKSVVNKFRLNECYSEIGVTYNVDVVIDDKNYNTYSVISRGNGDYYEVETEGNNETEIEFFCNETDEGIDIYNKGIINKFDSEGYDSAIDYCSDSNYVAEYYCDDSVGLLGTWKCENGCVDGACLQEVEEEKGSYEGYWAAEEHKFISSTVSYDGALENCKKNSNYNPGKWIQCYWNGDLIYEANKPSEEEEIKDDYPDEYYSTDYKTTLELSFPKNEGYSGNFSLGNTYYSIKLSYPSESYVSAITGIVGSNSGGATLIPGLDGILVVNDDTSLRYTLKDYEITDGIVSLVLDIYYSCDAHKANSGSILSYYKGTIKSAIECLAMYELRESSIQSSFCYPQPSSNIPIELKWNGQVIETYDSIECN